MKVWAAIMTITEAAEYLRLSKDTLYKYAERGKVPAFKLGNRWRFRKIALDGWMDVLTENVRGES